MRILNILYCIYPFICSYIHFWFCCLFAKTCMTLCNPMNYSMPGSSVHGIFQARILEWVAISLSRGSSLPRDGIHIFCLGRWILYHWAMREAFIFSSVQFSRSVVSDSLRSHELQHTRSPCPSPAPGPESNSCPSRLWCHLTISSSVIPFSCPQSFPASGSFPVVS